MARPDYRGARGANAGDDFHELWALRTALTLLDQDTALCAIAVEGLRAGDENGVPASAWDGVDCTFYYGNEAVASAERVTVVQLKYSGANPDQAWNIPRLTHSTDRQRSNSVIGRLAQAFSDLQAQRPDLIEHRHLAIQLISNQPIAPAVAAALADDCPAENPERTALQRASGLADGEFSGFLRCLDFTECGQHSRFALEANVLAAIAEWTDADARAATDQLKACIHRKMLPEAAGDVITRQTVLSWMGVSYAEALFPCPSAIAAVAQPVSRAIAATLTNHLREGNRYLCLHGEGGCGKTTALHEVSTLLPPQSVLLVFDCYGGGRYLDADALRHRPGDAFLHLTNDLARRFRLPLLVSASRDHDYPRLFARRLRQAAVILATRDPDALLVVAVDAADNAVTAASRRSEPCFVIDFCALGNLPANVRLVVTARTGRLPALALPHQFVKIPMTPFSRCETAAFARGTWPDIPEMWIKDFHALSNGNPRVQSYAREFACGDCERALAFLRPHGKELADIFRDQLARVHHEQDIATFCASLITLPRPIPLPDLSAVTGMSEAALRDLVADLTPGVRIQQGYVSFADEDFEQFIRAEADAQLAAVVARVADHLTHRHRTDAYAAAHLATALLATNRRQAIIALVNDDEEPTAILDPVVRRAVYVERLRIAMRVCRETGNTIDGVLTLLRGAEARKTDTLIRQLLSDNPDLAAALASERASRIVLSDPAAYAQHGPLLSHRLAVDARAGDGIAVREGFRQLDAWLLRRRDALTDNAHPGIAAQEWRVTDADIAAGTEAVLRLLGPRTALEQLTRWRPRRLALRVASILASHLIASGDAALLQQCLVEAGIPSPWDLFLRVPLALAGEATDVAALATSLSCLPRYRMIDLAKVTDAWTDPTYALLLDDIVSACEVVVAHGGDHAAVTSLLEQLADPTFRRRDRLSLYYSWRIDVSLRAHALLERMAGRPVTLESYAVDPPESTSEPTARQRQQREQADREKRDELSAVIGPLIALYDARAQALLGRLPPDAIAARLAGAIANYHNQSYRYHARHSASELQERATCAITRLMAVPAVDRRMLFDQACAMLGARSDAAAAAWSSVYATFTLATSLHEPIISAVAAHAAGVRHLRMTANEKLSALTTYARLLLPISPHDARALFEQAVDVAGETNEEAIFEIGVLAPLAARAVSGMQPAARRSVAVKVAAVVSDTGVRLSWHDHFPWEDAARALATLDVPVAFAAAARWEDAGLVGRETFLPPVLTTALALNALTPAQVSACTALFDELDEDAIGQLVTQVLSQHATHLRAAIAEHLAREEVLRFGLGGRRRVTELLEGLVAGQPQGYWMKHLACMTEFHQQNQPANLSSVSGDSDEETDPCAGIDLTTYRFTDPATIIAVIEHITTAVRAANGYIAPITILGCIQASIPVRDRVAYLDALCQSAPTVSAYTLAHAIAQCLTDWPETPAVTGWCRAHLMPAIATQLPGFSAFLDTRQFSLQHLLAKTHLDDRQISEQLLGAMEHHVDGLDIHTLYRAIGLVCQYCAADDAAAILTRYAERLLARIPAAEREPWRADDLPANSADSLARLLYALLSDVDSRVRWRAAHALRHLARLGATDVLDRVVALYDRTTELCFRMPDAAFYWLAARLWLLIALDRIATETPAAVARHGPWLCQVAGDAAFPHVLARAFAKSAVAALADAGLLALDPVQRGGLLQANAGTEWRKRARSSFDMGFDRDTRAEAARRFHFDSTDTLPYWYADAARIFAGVSGAEFLNAAERWIVDRWGVDGDPWRWSDEPRRDRITDRLAMLTSHHHGSLPAVERFSTHLEWHAMYCAVGELMATRALAEGDADAYDTFDGWLARDGLTIPPSWLADLVGPKPLDAPLWFLPPDPIDRWLEAVSDDDIFAEAGLTSGERTLVVGGDHATRSRYFAASVRVHSALVSPDTSGALLRALQTVDDPWVYRLPAAVDDAEIDVPPYRLIGWLAYPAYDPGIDEQDPFHYESRRIECHPSAGTSAALQLNYMCDPTPCWVSRGGEAVFVYQAWGDTRGDEPEERYLHRDGVRSGGWRLRVEREILQSFLRANGCDLILEVEITRRNHGYGYDQRLDAKDEKEARFDRLLLLRRDGSCETADGRVGAWATPCPGDGTGG